MECLGKGPVFFIHIDKLPGRTAKVPSVQWIFRSSEPSDEIPDFSDRFVRPAGGPSESKFLFLI